MTRPPIGWNTARKRHHVAAVVFAWMAWVGFASAQAPSPDADPGLTVEGVPVDLEKLRKAVSAATASMAATPIDDGIPRAMPSEPMRTPRTQPEPTIRPVVATQPAEALPPPKELPPTLPGPTAKPTIPPLPAMPPGLPPPPAGVLTVDGVPVDPATIQFRWGGGCSTCGSPGCGGGGGGGGIGGLSCRGSRHCRPGIKECSPFPATNACERFLGALYEVVCCKDPCYEPYWDPIGNAAFFVDPVRPATMTRLRWDRGYNVRYPDRAEYFWARADGMGLGPRPYLGVKVAPRVDYHELTLYQEAARGPFSIWTELPYRNSDPVAGSGGSGFGDMKIGTKSVLLDREMVQLSFQFATFIPTGDALLGVGVEHVSLEPSLILFLKLSPNTGFQAQVSEWIPIAGDPGYAGAILHYHFSLNQTVWRPVHDVLVMSTWELNGWTFQDGAYTDPVLGPGQKAAGASYFSGGPGVRFSYCDKLDFGVGSAFALSYPHWAATQFRFELRYRY